MNEKITNAKLDRVASDADHARRHGVLRFSCDHSHLLITSEQDKNVRRDLLFDGRKETAHSAAAHMLQHASPVLMLELIRGYRLAKQQGLLE
jgi:hypothetical protein